MLTVASIIFVHGLGGHPYSTWAIEPPSRSSESSRPSSSQSMKSFFGGLKRKMPHEESEASSEPAAKVYWPQDFLPIDCPTTRILTYGYDSQISHGYKAVDVRGVYGHAKSFLNDIRNARVKNPKRPLIWIAHSLGGLVVKEVVVVRDDESQIC